MARDAAVAADPSVDFAPYDNDGNGFVDAFIVIHAGAGGEATGNPGTSGRTSGPSPRRYNTDSTNIFAYLTIPEDARSASARTSWVTCCSVSRTSTTSTTAPKESATGA